MNKLIHQLKSEFESSIPSLQQNIKVHKEEIDSLIPLREQARVLMDIDNDELAEITDAMEEVCNDPSMVVYYNALKLKQQKAFKKYFDKGPMSNPETVYNKYDTRIKALQRAIETDSRIISEHIDAIDTYNKRNNE